MASRRMLKAAEAIREVVSMAILTEIRDPRVQNVTVTNVEVTPDMRSAKVLVSVMADEPKQHLCLKGLANSTGFLQSKIAKRVETRYTPKITFELDQGVKKSIEVQRILHELAEERKQREQALGGPPESDDDGSVEGIDDEELDDEELDDEELDDEELGGEELDDEELDDEELDDEELDDEELGGEELGGELVNEDTSETEMLDASGDPDDHDKGTSASTDPKSS